MTDTKLVDRLANELRMIDGTRDLGAGAIAEQLVAANLVRPPFNLADVVYYGEIIDAANRRVRVGWLNDSGDLVEGTARAIVTRDGGGGFAGLDDDVRDCWLHVSATFEVWLPLPDCAARRKNGEFSIA